MDTPARTGEHLWRMAILVALGAIAAALFALAGPSATAQSAGIAAPTRVATVDLVKLINGLEQFQAGQVQSDAFTEELRDAVESARQNVDSAREDMEMATEATRDQLFGDFVDAISAFRAEAAAFDVKRFARQNVILRETWASVRAGIEDYAQENDIDLVISDDSLVQAGITMDADPERYKQFMMSRRVLFAGDPIDITDELVTRMNIEYRAQLGEGDGG
jgi:Skp family chaperone for outer membrane proteins